ncbi:hypothetical protein LWI28_009856 [Acer negundo]|uniref:Uncharacterized protein n=1 Tax=Acer negundo TaxID=4023 RepID=A0AAD5P2N0_ACENE|nr:hypothetical protein LWI28_009856 [Acer negundo]
MEIAEPSLLLEVPTENSDVENFERLHGEGRVRIEDCLVGSLRIGVLCSMESPADRMEMMDVVAKLCAIRENFLSRRIGDRAANTGWGAQDKESKWGHEKFEGNKEGFRRGNKDSSFKPTGNGKALETHPKQSDRREEKSSRRHDNVENSREDNNKREEKRSRRQDTDEFEHGSIEDYERREEQRPRRHTDGEFELRSGGDQHRREENRPRRHGDEGGFERKPREDHNRREEKRPTRPDSESYTVTEEERTNGQLNGGILPLTQSALLSCSVLSLESHLIPNSLNSKSQTLDLSTDRLSIVRCFSHVRCRPTSWCAIASALSAFDLLKVLSIISLAKGIPT